MKVSGNALVRIGGGLSKMAITLLKSVGEKACVVVHRSSYDFNCYSSSLSSSLAARGEESKPDVSFACMLTNLPM